MEGFIIVLFVTACAVTSFHLGIVRVSYYWLLVGIALVVVATGIVFQKEIDKENRGQCFTYEDEGR